MSTEETKDYHAEQRAEVLAMWDQVAGEARAALETSEHPGFVLVVAATKDGGTFPQTVKATKCFEATNNLVAGLQFANFDLLQTQAINHLAEEMQEIAEVKRAKKSVKH